MNRIVIFGNGTLHKNSLKSVTSTDYVIGVDRAAYWLISHGIIPNVAIGDFDSTTKKELAVIKKNVVNVLLYPAKKDFTDMELAIRYAIEQKPSEAIIFGGIGSRMDQTMATWHLLDAVLVAKIPHALVNEKNSVRLVGKGRTILFSRGEYRYISILPFTKSISLKLTGFQYDVPKTRIIRGTTRGVSNELRAATAEIRIFSGKAWLMESND